MAEPAPTGLDRAAIARGALIGAAVILAVSFSDLAIGAVTEGDSEGRRPFLFLVVVAGYFAAGRAAVRRAERDPFRHGTLAALTSFGVWLAMRLIVAAVDKDGLADDALRGIFGHVVVSSAFGMLGGLFGIRELERQEQSEGPPAIH